MTKRPSSEPQPGLPGEGGFGRYLRAPGAGCSAHDLRRNANRSVASGIRMTDNSQPEKGSTTELFGWKVFFQKVSLMFADKILLGGFIALLAWGGTLWADRLKVVWSLHEKDKILNARFDACNSRREGHKGQGRMDPLPAALQRFASAQ